MLYQQGYPFVLVQKISFGANLASKQTSCLSMKELFPTVITRFTPSFTDRECVTTVQSATFCGEQVQQRKENRRHQIKYHLSAGTVAFTF